MNTIYKHMKMAKFLDLTIDGALLQMSDLKSHIIHGEASQNKDFRMLGPLSMRTNWKDV